MAPTAINLKIPCLVARNNDPKFLYILHDGPPLKSPVPSGVRFARTMGAKFGSKGAATAGRTSKCFIAPTGIDMAEKISAKLKRIQEAQEVRVPKAQPARQNWSAEMLQNKDMLQFLLGLFGDQESPDWLLIWLSLPPHTEPPLKSSNMARAGRMANIVSERTDQWSQRLNLTGRLPLHHRKYWSTYQELLNGISMDSGNNMLKHWFSRTCKSASSEQIVDFNFQFASEALVIPYEVQDTRCTKQESSHTCGDNGKNPWHTSALHLQCFQRTDWTVKDHHGYIKTPRMFCGDRSCQNKDSPFVMKLHCITPLHATLQQNHIVAASHFATA